MNLTKLLFLLIIASITIYGQNENNKPEDLSLSPISTFADACARCHGDEGNNYGKEFAKLDAEELQHVTEDMMYGPAYLDPTEIELKAMTAYQRAISNNEPFIVITNAASYIKGEDNNLKLETSLNTKLEQSENIEIQKGEKEFQFIINPNGKTNIEITAIRGDKKTTIIFPQEIYSHSKMEK